ncbi:MAG TPA: hypothetical protein VGR37_04720, partial [Longimicrobiaceae bacterium]|nr:hypothetical protein [Longimicrobiaceae bacterium]
MRRPVVIPLLVLALACPRSLSAQHEGHAATARRAGAPLEFGRVHFPNSGSPAAQEPFLRGMALLHSFEYRDAAEAFREAQQADPAFALPYWAEALTHSHVIWGQENLAAARAALTRLGPTPAARLARARTPGERAFAAAVEAMYGEGDEPTRVRAFADATRRWATAMPGDHEAHAFAALGALWQEHHTRDPAAAAALGAEASAHAQLVYQANPRHPGAAHYLIHAHDSPAGSREGLAAARAYATIAPDAEHALHMPSHIFHPLGMWDDMAASNERTWAASRASAAQGGRPGWSVSWHGLNWLQYAYLQQGRWAAARALVDTARALAEPARREPGGGRTDAAFALEELAFRYATETGRWDLWPADSVAMDWRDPALSARARGFAVFSAYQRAVAALLTRRDTLPAITVARAFREAVGAGRGTTNMPRLAAQLEATVLRARGDHAGALAMLQRLQPQARVPRYRSMVPPASRVVSEELGAALLEAGRAREAAGAYEQALEDRPRRAAALLGLARARAAAGDSAG